MVHLLERRHVVNRCVMGYLVNEDRIPPERCHSDGKYRLDSCKECSCYNKEFDLIDQAIESAKCRIYRLSVHESKTLEYQKKATNQQELMNITIKALEYYRNEA